MRRDICYFFPVSVETLFNAYLTAAKNPPFERGCKEEPFHTFSFGLNFSVKYNMNGGSCTVRFIPCEGGSAVNLRFTIAQALGARYEKYAEDLTSYAERILNVNGQRSGIDVEEFVKPENKIYSASSASQPVFQSAPQPAPQQASQAAPAKSGGFCPECGTSVMENASFCSECGTKLKKAPTSCPNCGTITPEGAKFCHSCGAKL